jgi:hypothetical protein
VQLGGVVKKRLYLILPDSLVALPASQDPRLLEPLDAAREGSRVEAVFAQEETVLMKVTRLY